MQYCFETYNRTPLDMYNGVSQVDLSNWKEESISIQMVKQCMNFSGNKPRTPLFFLAADKSGNYCWTYYLVYVTSFTCTNFTCTL